MSSNFSKKREEKQLMSQQPACSGSSSNQKMRKLGATSPFCLMWADFAQSPLLALIGETILNPSLCLDCELWQSEKKVLWTMSIVKTERTMKVALDVDLRQSGPADDGGRQIHTLLVQLLANKDNLQCFPLEQSSVCQDNGQCLVHKTIVLVLVWFQAIQRLF